MDLLAETNGVPQGRWVLVPRKGERFMGPRDRNRARVRRRRRLIFSVLVEATALSLIIGLFPPLRPMLVGTAVLSVLLVVYVGLLVKLKADEAHRARELRARRREALEAYGRVPSGAVRRAALATGYGSANGEHRLPAYGDGYRPARVRAAANGNGNGHHANGNGNGHHANRNGNGNGHHANGDGEGRRAGVEVRAMVPASVFDEADASLHETGVRILGDVHVVLRRPEDLQAEAVRAAAP